MTYGGGTHGRHQDEALKREARSEVQAGQATQGEEWQGPEPAVWAPTGRPGGTLPEQGADSVQLRSDLARHLDRAAFPVDRDHLLETLAGHHAPERLLDLAATLPTGTSYPNLGEVVRALGLPVEQQRP